MGKKPKRSNLKPPGTCLFCKRSPPDIKMSKEHIWSDWLDEIIPKQSTRTEGFTPNIETNPHNWVSYQGDVGTKKVRIVCTDCNNGWMSQIVENAKPYARQLVNGERISLDEVGQVAMADWIALSALMADRITKSAHKLPESDIAAFYDHRGAPANWFVGIGFFVGHRGISFNHASFPVGFLDERDGSKSIVFVKHAFASILGNLFTIVDVDVDISQPGLPPAIGPVYLPHIVAIQPRTAPVVPYPPPSPCIIWGPDHFWVGTHALAVARRAIDVMAAKFNAAGFTHV